MPHAVATSLKARATTAIAKLAALAVCAAALPGSISAASATVSAEDPSQSVACHLALAKLQSAEDAGKPPSVAAIRAAQQQAALACLGASALTQPKRAGQLQPPTSVPPVSGQQRTAPVPGPTAGIPVHAPTGVLLVTNCDALGCWASDGSRLTGSGPLLMGIKGTCTVSGSVLNCP